MLPNEFCDNYFSPVGLLMRLFARPIFCLTHLTFCPQTRNKQVAPSGYQVLSEPFSSVLAQTVSETDIFGVKGGSRRLKNPLLNPLHKRPNPSVNVAHPNLLPPIKPPMSSPCLATDEKLLVNSRKIILIFNIFFKLFEIFVFFEFY